MLTSIRLQNFRSYKDASFEFDPGVNIIIGPNASGKTNLLEAIHYLAHGNGFRSFDRELVRTGAKWARIDGLTEKNQDRIIKLQVNRDAVIKSISINGDEAKRIVSVQQIPVVLFEPNQLYSLTTSPEQRRVFIDALAQQISKDFQKKKRDYSRTLVQRNRLLKNARGRLPSDDIFAWDVRLSQTGHELVKERVELINKVNHHLSEHYEQIAGSAGTLKLIYLSKTNIDNYADNLFKQLQSNITLDILKGYTSNGPHRDDIRIELNGQDIRQFASRGETRTTLLSLKVQEARFIAAQTKQKPLLLLDDVFSELDGARRHALTAFLKDHQSFITTTDADVIQKESITKNAPSITLA